MYIDELGGMWLSGPVAGVAIAGILTLLAWMRAGVLSLRPKAVRPARRGRETLPTGRPRGR